MQQAEKDIEDRSLQEKSLHQLDWARAYLAKDDLKADDLIKALDHMAKFSEAIGNWGKAKIEEEKQFARHEKL